MISLWMQLSRLRQATKKKKKLFNRGKKDEKKIALKQLKALFQTEHTDGASVMDSGSDSDEHGSPRQSPIAQRKSATNT